jgi:hypothetical protein
MNRLLLCLAAVTSAIALACSEGDRDPPDAPQPAATPASGRIGAPNCPEVSGTPRRRLRDTPPPDRADALAARLCLTEVDIHGDPVRAAGAEASEEFDYRMIEVPQALLPALTDSNSPAFRDNGTIYVFQSAWGETNRSEGVSLERIRNPTKVQLPVPERPGVVWIEAVWKDFESGILYGWYHFEPTDLPCLTAPTIGAALSYDNGLTWEDRGFILENGYPIDCSHENGWFVGGNGDFSVILDPDGEYFYFLFSNYGGPIREQGIGVARSRFEDRGQPGTVVKFFLGNWREPGLGGRVTPVFTTPTGWAVAFMDSFWGPSVHWNSFVNAYVVLLNRAGGPMWEQEGVYMSLSKDLLRWSSPQKILDSNDFYPQVLGFRPEGTDTYAGSFFRIYVHGISRHVLEFIAPAGEHASTD